LWVYVTVSDNRPILVLTDNNTVKLPGLSWVYITQDKMFGLVCYFNVIHIN
jgi:hypothetical protein